MTARQVRGIRTQAVDKSGFTVRTASLKLILIGTTIMVRGSRILTIGGRAAEKFLRAASLHGHEDVEIRRRARNKL